MDPISAVFGGSLIVFGWLMRRWHRLAWRQEQIDFIDDSRELKHYQARFRRRNRTSGLIAGVGLLIVLADLPVVWQRGGPIIATLLWCAVVALCVWIGLLAIGDFATTRAHAQANLARLQAQKQQLMGQLDSLRSGPPNSETTNPEAN